ncbi:hypothetical protein RAS1_12870 [Phycisphaerae bacterium RAS1]|nr:hypothetical protein RAS1_12870 [Phycisphaerae bacterium RAS1]
MTHPGRALTFLVSLLALAAVAAAQQPSGAPLEAQRGKPALTADDVAAIKTWLSERVDAVGQGDAGSGEALTQLRTAYDGTPAFKEAFAAATIEAVRGKYKLLKTDGAARLLILVSTLGVADGGSLLAEALADERAAARFSAAAGLRTLRPRLALAGGEYVSRALQALRDGGKKETSRRTLEIIYRAMSYAELPSPPDPKPHAAALLDVLESRAEQYAKLAVSAEGADVVGLETAAALKAGFSDEEKKRLAVVAAKMLRYAVWRYVAGDAPLSKVGVKATAADNPLVDVRNATELLIEEAEKRLVELTAPSNPIPNITEQMKKSADTTQMKIQMDAWATHLQRALGMDFRVPESDGR